MSLSFLCGEGLGKCGDVGRGGAATTTDEMCAFLSGLGGEGGEGLGICFEVCFPMGSGVGETGVGFEEDGFVGVLMESGEVGEVLLNGFATVDAEHVDGEVVECGGHFLRGDAVDGFLTEVVAEGDDEGDGGVCLTDGFDGEGGFLKVELAFEEKEIDTGLGECGGLFTIGGLADAGGSGAVGAEGLTTGADGTCNEDVRGIGLLNGLLGEFDGLLVDFFGEVAEVGVF